MYKAWKIKHREEKPTIRAGLSLNLMRFLPLDRCFSSGFPDENEADPMGHPRAEHFTFRRHFHFFRLGSRVKDSHFEHDIHTLAYR